VVNGVTPSDVMVGQSATAQGDLHATRWSGEEVLDLTPGTGIMSEALAVNTRLTIVGQRNAHAWFWTPQGGQDLGTLPGGGQATLVAINTLDIAVGTHSPAGAVAPGQAIRWAGGALEDLNTLVEAPGWVLESAVGINDRGVIAGMGRFQGQPRGWLLVPGV